MIKDITIGQFIEGDSLLHRADPRTKILLTILFMVMVLLMKNTYGFFLLSMITVFAVLISGVPIKMIIRGFKPIIYISIFAIVVNAFSNNAPYMMEIGIIHISYEGIWISILMMVKFMVLIAGSSLLTYTTTPISLTDGLESLLRPLGKIGLPSHDIAMMMTISLRFIPTILDETEKIIKAQASRGADFDSGNIIVRAKSYIPVLVPLFIGAFRRADELALAMEARCYQGGRGRTRMKQLKLGMEDLKLSVIMISVVVILIFINKL